MGYYDNTKIGVLTKKVEAKRDEIKAKQECQELKHYSIKWGVTIGTIIIISSLLTWKPEWFFLLGVITPFALAAWHLVYTFENETR